MPDQPRFYLTTAIDYPNSLPHIGTAFEKVGADVQARYRRMEGYNVFFLMGNDENTVKVARKAAQLGRDTQEYCNEMAAKFREVWDTLGIQYDDFIQTSEPRHHIGCRKFIQRVYDNGHIYKGTYEGLYCEGCEEFKKESEIKDAGGVCPNHKTPPIRRSEPCYFFALSKFRDRLLKFYEEHPDFIQPEARRNEILSLVQTELLDVNISRRGEKWGIRVPFDEEYTIYVWFDALLNYITAIGYGTDEERFRHWWPADVHFIGKDITRFHCALWPAMCFAAGIEPPRKVFGHGFVYVKNEETGVVEKISKSLGNAINPMDIIQKFGPEQFRYYFLSQCPFPSDGEFGWERFATVNDADLANKLGNLNSRVLTLITGKYAKTLEGTAGHSPQPIDPALDLAALVEEIRGYVETCRYHLALQTIWQKIVTPANVYLESYAPWTLVKTDREAAKQVVFNAVGPLRTAAILCKPFLPKKAETIYKSFNFTIPWESVRYADAAQPAQFTGDLHILAELDDKGKPKPLFPRIG